MNDDDDRGLVLPLRKYGERVHLAARRQLDLHDLLVPRRGLERGYRCVLVRRHYGVLGGSKSERANGEYRSKFAEHGSSLLYVKTPGADKVFHTMHGALQVADASPHAIRHAENLFSRWSAEIRGPNTRSTRRIRAASCSVNRPTPCPASS